MYRITVLKNGWDSTIYQTNYPSGTGYLDTCWMANFFLVLCVVWIFPVLVVFSFVCFHTAYVYD